VPKEQNASEIAGIRRQGPGRLALARLEPALRLVDHINATPAANQAIVSVAKLQGFQGILDFHGSTSCAGTLAAL